MFSVSLVRSMRAVLQRGAAAAAAAAASASAGAVAPVVPGKTRVGWIGAGVMGAAMCQHVLGAGYSVTVYSRTERKVEPLLARGAALGKSPADVAARSDVVFTMVGFPRDVSDVVLGPAGVLSAARAGSVLVDMTTSRPILAKAMADQAAERGVHVLDAPVSGGDVGARNGTLTVMVGGAAPVLEAVRPLLQAFSSTVTHFGTASAGQHAKMVNQILIASKMVGLCEGLLYAYQAGLDASAIIGTLSQGAAGSWSLTNYGPRINNRKFDPGFLVEHFIKDMSIALYEAQRLGLALPGLALANQLYIALQNQGHGRKGTHALILALEHLNNITHVPSNPVAKITPDV